MVEAQRVNDMGKEGNSGAMRKLLLADVFVAFDVDSSGFVGSEELMQMGSARQVDCTTTALYIHSHCTLTACTLTVH